MEKIVTLPKKIIKLKLYYFFGMKYVWINHMNLDSICHIIHKYSLFYEISLAHLLKTLHLDACGNGSYLTIAYYDMGIYKSSFKRYIYILVICLRRFLYFSKIIIQLLINVNKFAYKFLFI